MTVSATNALNLHPYQQKDLQKILDRLGDQTQASKLLYQLPTGGGKTVLFAEIAKGFISRHQRNVLVLTHRVELCAQTSATLQRVGIKNKIINSQVKKLRQAAKHECFVAMVETLNNRLENGAIDLQNVGLVIIDEAHHNAFQKLLDKFTDAHVIGVTATPLSSNASQPLYKDYDELMVGESIESLIDQGYLAKPKMWRYDVEMDMLKTGSNGDFTVSTSDALYGSEAMQELLLHAYQSHSKNKKTLIFNNGVFTSKAVLETFRAHGYDIQHLDHHTPPTERTEILKWFKHTKGAILTSVSLLTTGFDEPSVQTVILNRATTSLTLYHQMIGRGSRKLPGKKTFTIIDLGNNSERFGDWQKGLDWHSIFQHPEAFLSMLQSQSSPTHLIPLDLKNHFPKTLQFGMDIQEAYQQTIASEMPANTVIKQSIKQHAAICMENSSSIAEALDLIQWLDSEIQWRIKQYGKCISKVTKNYLEWLYEDYHRRLEEKIKKSMQRNITPITPLHLSA